MVLYDRVVKVGILTGGGDCPGLNAVIRAVVRKGEVGRRVMTSGGDVVGVREGWKGLVEGLFEPLGPREISGLLPRGGTIIGTTRTNPYKIEGGVDALTLEGGRIGLADHFIQPNYSATLADLTGRVTGLSSRALRTVAKYRWLRDNFTHSTRTPR